MENNIEWNNEIEKNIYYKSLERIAKYEHKKLRFYKGVSMLALIILFVSVFMFTLKPFGKSDKNTVAAAEELPTYEQQYVEHYEEFFTFTDYAGTGSY